MRSRQEPLYHVALASDWDTAKAGSSGYRTSTLGVDLSDAGFIHCSYAEQVQDIANTVYRGQSDVVLLAIDQEKVTSRIVEEPADRGEHEGEEYPHIYGPIDMEAVVEVWRLEPREDGTFELPALRSAE